MPARGLMHGRRRTTAARSYPPITEADIDKCQALMWALIERMIHDTCGATCTGHSYHVRLRIARKAYAWLYSREPARMIDRSLVCEFLGLDPQAFDDRMAIAAVPFPCEETMRVSWTILEQVYWRLGGSQGEPPRPRGERSLGYVKKRRSRKSRLTGHAPRRYPERVTQPRPEQRRSAS